MCIPRSTIHAVHALWKTVEKGGKMKFYANVAHKNYTFFCKFTRGELLAVRPNSREQNCRTHGICWRNHIPRHETSEIDSHYRLTFNRGVRGRQGNRYVLLVSRRALFAAPTALDEGHESTAHAIMYGEHD